MSVAQRLREARERTGISAKALDVRADLTKGHTSLIESGRRKRLAAETAQKLAGALGVSIEWLLDGRAPDPEESSPTLPDPDDSGPQQALTDDTMPALPPTRDSKPAA